MDPEGNLSSILSLFAMIWDDLRRFAMERDYPLLIAMICDDCCYQFELQIKKATKNNLITATESLRGGR
jgi:hypothetical protein